MFICASARVCPANGCSSAHRPHVCAPPTAQDGGMGADLSLNFMPLGPTAAMCGTTPGQQKWGDRTFMNMI